MSIFADLQKEQEKQKKQLEGGSEVVFPAQTHEQEHAHEDAQSHTRFLEHKSTREPAQEVEQILKLPQKLPTTDTVETLSFKTRRDTKVKVNTEVPQIWKIKLDEIAHQLKVGKYELLAYIIGNFLDEV